MTEPFLITNKDKVLRALQLTQLEGLMEIDRICRKHGIEYSLDGGTCLGRMRHGGFIPWDDDIDVDMTPDNYDKFMSVAPAEIDSDRFFLRCKQTDPNHFRTAAKLEIKGTVMEFGGWRNAKIKAGVFVDIFRTCYLPDDKKLREKITHKLFMIHAVENHRMLGANTRALRDNYNLFWWIVSELVPIKWIMKWEDRIIDKYGRTKSGWMVDDAIANGDYGGYPAEGSDEFVDADFEGITVRDKKDADGFLRYQYGPDYNEWLPPTKRLSHHKWLTFDLGSYADKYDIPDNYEDYLTIKYNEAKLRQMQTVSLMMADKIDEICRKHGLVYYMLGYNAYSCLNPKCNMAEIWHEPLKIGMPRADYERFIGAAREELDDRYEVQSIENTADYFYIHGKVRLNYTELRDSRIPEDVDFKSNSGFYVDIVPMDNAPDNSRDRSKQADAANRLENKLIMKWTRSNFYRFRRLKFKNKVKVLLMAAKTVEAMADKLTAAVTENNDNNTDYYIYSNCENRTFFTAPKAAFGSGVRKNFLGHSLMFPAGDYLSSDECERINDPDELIEVIGNVTKRYSSCFLNYYDNREYQLSVLRYDHENDRLMTNDELFGSADN